MNPCVYVRRPSWFAMRAAPLILLSCWVLVVGCGAPATRTLSDAPVASLQPCRRAVPANERSGLFGRHACDQSVVLNMPEPSGEPSAQCSQCHGTRLGSEPKVNESRSVADKKSTIELMHHGFDKGLRTRDGSETTCASCHADRNGRPAAKFLGEPRDIEYTMEWMNLVLASKFTRTDGGKLRCRDCHGSNFGEPGFHGGMTMRANPIDQPGAGPADGVAQVQGGAPW